MAESLAAWLALREPVDHTSRSIELTRAIASAMPADRPLRIVDLGSGTASNVRYLSPLLPSPQRWVLVDSDATLLDEALSETGAALRGTAAPALDVETRRMNLGELDESVIVGAHLVTASALLDLVSDSWLRKLAQACRAHRAAALFALTYNGRSHCTPPEPEDDRVRDVFNTHQRRNDKGFGAAAGPDAVDCAAEAFGDAGYRVRREPSDWLLTPDMALLQAQLIDGWAEAASEIAPAEASTISSWRARRRAHVSAGRSTIVVCHEDLAATLVELPR